MSNTTSYRVTGMTCGGCSSAMTKALAKAAPGLKAEVSHEAVSYTHLTLPTICSV